MTENTADRAVPRGAILGAAALIAFAIVAAGIGRLTGFGAVHANRVTHLETTELRFEDRADGGISVIAPESGAVLGVLPAGRDGFVRTVLRSLAFDRRRHHVGAGPSFVITRWADGGATLEDPATGRHVDLAAFGAANMQAFANLMTMRGSKL